MAFPFGRRSDRHDSHREVLKTLKNLSKWQWDGYRRGVISFLREHDIPEDMEKLLHDKVIFIIENKTRWKVPEDKALIPLVFSKKNFVDDKIQRMLNAASHSPEFPQEWKPFTFDTNYAIEEEGFGSFTKYKLKNITSGAYVSIIPEFGANVNEIVLAKHNTFYPVLEGDPNYHTLIANEWYRGAKLVPYPNRINDGVWHNGRKKLSLPINFKQQHHSIHGLVYDKKFTIKRRQVTKDDASMDIEYHYRKDSHGFPFDFDIRIRYSLSHEGFTCTTMIINRTHDIMPMGDGWHPYFKTGAKVDTLHLKLPSCQMLHVDDRMIPTGEMSMFPHFRAFTPIARTSFDTGFMMALTGQKVSTEVFDPIQNIRVVMWQETGPKKYNYLQVFIPPSRDCIALEPMTCAPDALNNQRGIIRLPHHEIFTASYGVRLE